MKNMRSILMIFNPGFFIIQRITVAPYMRSLFDDENLFSELVGNAFSDNAPEQPCANHEIIAVHEELLQAGGTLPAKDLITGLEGYFIKIKIRRTHPSVISTLSCVLT